MHELNGPTAHGSASAAPASTSYGAELKSKLAGLALLDDLDQASLSGLAAEVDWFSLPGGQCLFKLGDPGDSLYIVISGRLGAFLPNDEGRETLVRQMLSGETVGEMALLSGEPRSASIYALRDTELVRLSKASFERLVDEHPKTLRVVTDLLVTRLRNPPRLSPSKDAPRTVAIVPLQPGDWKEFGRSLLKAFEELNLKASLLDQSHAEQQIGWFHAVEAAHDVLLYLADFESTAWTRQCLRQAECALLVAEAARDLPPNPRPDAPVPFVRTPVELAILHHSDSFAPGRAAQFLERLDVQIHHNVRRGVPRDFRRLARMITRRAIGIVLSGGGARGLGHVGVLRALHQAGFEIDLYGGASMGSIIAGGAALGWDDRELAEHMRAAFALANPANDYTLPMVALVRGRKTSRFLREHFGDTRIEDCPFPYFCVSSNLTRGRLKIHRSGPLWLATRASVAIPGVLPPVVDGSDILIDGGIINNLPIDVMSDMRRGPIIASDVSMNYGFHASIDDIDQRSIWQLMRHARKGTPNIFTVLMAAGTVSSYLQVRELSSHVDLLIEPHLEHISMLNWGAFDSAVEAGYQSTMKLLERKKGELSPEFAFGCVPTE